MSVVCPNGHPSQAQDYCDTCGAAIDLSARPAAQPSESAGGSLGLDPEVAAPALSGTLAPSAPTPPSGASPAVQTCPNCATDNSPESLFCEACGYDFTTGAMPRGAATASAAPEAPDAANAPEAPGAGEVGGIPSPQGSPEPAAAPAAPYAGTGVPPAIEPGWVVEVWIDPDWYAVQDAEEPMPSPGLPTIVPLSVRSALVGRVSASKNIHPDVDCTSDSGVSRRHAQLTTDGSRWFVEDLGSANGTFVGGIDEPLPEDPIPVGPKRELEADDRIYVGAWTRLVVRKALPGE